MPNRNLGRCAALAPSLLFWSICACGGRGLTVKTARDVMADPPLALSKENDATIESVRGGVIEARVKVAMRVEREAGGEWVIRDVRIGDRPWERLADLLKALDQVKSERTRSMLAEVGAAIGRYASEMNALPEFRDFAELSDRLSPGYLTPMVRIDGWERPFAAHRTGVSAIRLVSAGSDGIFGSADDISLDVRHPR